MTEGEFAPFIEGLIRAEEHERKLLKPCPFCGAKAMLVYCIHGVGANWAVECTETHAHRIEFTGTQDEIIKEWNQRAKE